MNNGKLGAGIAVAGVAIGAGLALSNVSNDGALGNLGTTGLLSLVAATVLAAVLTFSKSN